MSRVYALAGALALAVVLAGTAVQAEDDKIPSISDIMKKAHGKEGLRSTVSKDLKEKEWESALKTAKEWKSLSEALVKNKAPKGESESWKKQTATYDKTLGTLVKAIEDKNAKSATGALGKIGSSCKSCHTAHRPPKE